MTRLLSGFMLAATLWGCGGAVVDQRINEEPPPEVATLKHELRPPPTCYPICVGHCSRTPPNEPLGQACWLVDQRCLISSEGCGILTCYYKCVPVASSGL